MGVRRNLAVLLAAAALGGCAFGRTYSYGNANLNLPITSSSSVAVAVQDARPYVLSGNKPERFVGLMRGGFGNPFDVNTQSGGPIAVEMRDAVVKALQNKGIQATPVTVAPSDPQSRARRLVADSKAGKGILVTLKEWKSDTMMATSLYYDVSLAVLDASGNTLAENAIKGSDNLGSLGLSPNAGIAATFVKKFEILFDDPKVLAALK